MLSTRPLLARSIWKGPNIVPLPIQRPSATPPGSKPPAIRTQARSATILPNFVGLRFQVHNGKSYTEVEIGEEMVGKKLGEFSGTRKQFRFKQTKNR